MTKLIALIVSLSEIISVSICFFRVTLWLNLSSVFSVAKSFFRQLFTNFAASVIVRNVSPIFF